jgi:hypothetical protein
MMYLIFSISFLTNSTNYPGKLPEWPMPSVHEDNKRFMRIYAQRAGRAGQVLVCHFVGQEEKPGKSTPVHLYRRARLTRPAR